MKCVTNNLVYEQYEFIGQGHPETLWGPFQSICNARISGKWQFICHSDWSGTKYMTV
jgi:hypothetical protein